MQCYRAKIYFFINIKIREIGENFPEILGKFPKFRKFAKIFPENFPENSRKILGKFGMFLIQLSCYSAKIHLFVFIKVRNLGENFPGSFRKISEMSKLLGRNFSGKFPGNSGCFFRVNTMLQSVNLLFYVYKR